MQKSGKESHPTGKQKNSDRAASEAERQDNSGRMVRGKSGKVQRKEHLLRYGGRMGSPEDPQGGQGPQQPRHHSSPKPTAKKDNRQTLHSGLHTEEGFKMRAWGHDTKPAEPYYGTKCEKWLWATFMILLLLVILFSQRSWLGMIFSFNYGEQQLYPPVTIVRTSAEPSVADTTLSEEAGEVMQAAAGQNLLQRFDQLLRIDGKEDRREDTHLRDMRLFFVKVAEDGQLQLRSVLHKVSVDSAPLSRTLEQLLRGPSPQEINKGLHSMLSPEMEILGVRIVGTTAILNVSAEFYQASELLAVLLTAVKQLVFTVTEFPGVKALRILTEGQPIFAENLPTATAKGLEQQGINLNSELRRDDLWQGKMAEFSPEAEPQTGPE